jgi:hypothetical protein
LLIKRKWPWVQRLSSANKGGRFTAGFHLTSGEAWSRIRAQWRSGRGRKEEDDPDKPGRNRQSKNMKNCVLQLKEAHAQIGKRSPAVCRPPLRHRAATFDPACPGWSHIRFFLGRSGTRTQDETPMLSRKFMISHRLRRGPAFLSPFLSQKYLVSRRLRGFARNNSQKGFINREWEADPPPPSPGYGGQGKTQ